MTLAKHDTKKTYFFQKKEIYKQFSFGFLIFFAKSDRCLIEGRRRVVRHGSCLSVSCSFHQKQSVNKPTQIDEFVLPLEKPKQELPLLDRSGSMSRRHLVRDEMATYGRAYLLVRSSRPHCSSWSMLHRQGLVPVVVANYLSSFIACKTEIQKFTGFSLINNLMSRLK